MKTIPLLFLGLSLSGAGLLGCTATDLPPPPPPGELPQSCLDILTRDPSAVDGTYAVFLGGARDRPWEVYCHDMAAYPSDYLTLPSPDPRANRSRLATYNAARGDYQAVETHYRRVRIDPRSLELDLGDQTFAESVGAAVVQGGIEVTSMPFAVAAACSEDPELVMAAESSVDLGGTPFIIGGSFCTRNANPAVSGVDLYYDRSVAELSVYTEGIESCATASPEPCLAAPYNAAGGFQLQLIYQGDRP